MITFELIKRIENELLNGNLGTCIQYAGALKCRSVKILEEENINVDELLSLIMIYGILYNNRDSEDLLIDDGIYDMMVAKYQSITGMIPVGAPLVDFKNSVSAADKQEKAECVKFYNTEEDLQYRSDNIKMYPELFIGQTTFNAYNTIHMTNREKTKVSPVLFNDIVTKRTRNTQHEHPELVGTLDKCKFVLVNDAIEAGADINDPKIKILERDFFAEHIKNGIIDPNGIYEIMMSLKYDGISVEADCTNVVESARSRGDTGIDQASDMTPILKGYPFPNSTFYRGIGDEGVVGVKFEAIMTYQDLYKFNELRGKNYKNCRTAIIGLFGASDAPLYRDFITLVPLDIAEHDALKQAYAYTDNTCNSFREMRALFMDCFTSKGVRFINTKIRGDYKTLLFMIKKFLQEADYARAFMPYMYDGIVIEYLDDEIREKLGRKNSVNQFSMAVKFDPMKKQTIFREYKYTVGKDRTITPMIYYDPVEFFGTIHPKSSGHSRERFMKLNLKPGDIIDVTYTNDVMPYVTKPENSVNASNPNHPIEFTKVCPACGAPVEISESGKSAKCSNVNCPGARLAIMTDTLSKLGFVGFADSAVMTMNRYHIKDILDCPVEQLGLGVADTENFAIQKQKIMSEPMYDYDMLGSLGFSNISSEKWAKVCNRYNLEQIIEICLNKDIYPLIKLKGIGDLTATTIISEFPYYKDDILYCMGNMNIVSSVGADKKVSIRYSGIRNKQLMEQLISMGYDAKDSSVTKSTDILLVPYEGFTSSKTSKAGENTMILPVDYFIENMDNILAMLK